MRSNIVSEAGLPTRFNQWWGGIPFVTSGVVIICGCIYLVCLLIGYDSYNEICFSPSAVISQFQVYRIYTSVLFHGSLLHVLFNMLASVPLGSELERVMGSVRLLHVTFLLATSNAIFHIIIAVIVAHFPFHPYQYLMNECSIGFSGVIFSMIVIETSLSRVQSRSVFGLFNVPAKWYAWILLVLFQLLMTNVSLLGHLCGILSGFAYIRGLFNFLIPGSSFYSSIESSSILSACVRSPRFILCTGVVGSGHLPAHSNSSSLSSNFMSGNIWRSFSSGIPQRETTDNQPPQGDNRFPGRGLTIGSSPVPSSNYSSLQTRLLDSSTIGIPGETASTRGQQLSNVRNISIDSVAAVGGVSTDAQLSNYNDELEKLVGMGFEKTHAEVALAAADGNLNIAVEILMSQRG